MHYLLTATEYYLSFLGYYFSFIGIFCLMEIWVFAEPLLIVSRFNAIVPKKILAIALVNFLIVEMFGIAAGNAFVAPFRAVFENPEGMHIFWYEFGMLHLIFLLSPVLKIRLYRNSGACDNLRFKFLVFSSTYFVGILGVYATYLSLAQDNML